MSKSYADTDVTNENVQQESDSSAKQGLVINRFYTKKGIHPFDQIKWEYRTASITNEKGAVIFEQKDIEVPDFWTQLAVNVVVSKYFHGKPGTPERETSIKQLIGRVVNTTTEFGWKDGYFADEESREVFRDELTYILVNQHLAFNSPVWFNVGIESVPQTSACFINSVKDNLDSIMDLAKTEGMLFKFGSGTGTNLSTLRSSKESLSGGGTSSGPISFMKGYDAFAGVIKSGGKTRRAAKMVILNDSHPDIVDFITSKEKEEKKAWALIDAGYDGSFNGEAYGSVAFQNANHSVRVSDEFMNAVINNGEWHTKYVTTGENADSFKAKDLMNMIAESTHVCGDPGLQYDSTINKWHTCKNSGKINASNPCVTGKTRVLTKDGRWQRIDNILERKTDIIVNLNELNTSQINGSFKTGIKPVYLLKTKSGYELELTADHKVYTENRGFIQAYELTKDDFVKFPQNVVGEIREPEDYKFYQMLGYYIGDGSGTSAKEHGIQLIASKDHEGKKILESFANYISENYERKTHKESHAKLCERDATYSYTITVNECKAQMAELIDLSLKSHEKIISDQIFNLDLGKQKFILQGLFTADGTVANYGDKSQYVSLDSSSLELLKNTQLMLLGFGIKSKIYLNRRAGKTSALLPDGKGGIKEYSIKEMYALRISKSNRIKFEELIGFMPESEKSEKLAIMNKLVSTYKDEMFDKVDSLEYIGEQEVYDLTEPITSSFIANGLVIHNCSEYVFLDDTACNLASINLMKYLEKDGSFDIEGYIYTIDTSILAQEIFVSNASYPTKAIERNSHIYRTLGLGYANLGAVLMAKGLPYDSDTGREYAAVLTSIMTGEAYNMSAKIAEKHGAFSGYAMNREPMLEVIGMHKAASEKIDPELVDSELFSSSLKVWMEAYQNGEQFGYRNAQVTVIAPTGTIAFLMDCDTTGIEPDIALVKYKKLVGGGFLKIVNNTVPLALRNLGYSEEETEDIIKYIDENETIEGSPLKEKDLAVFDCAFRALNGTRSIHYMGHVRMMAAVQPFISGAISKTVNMPTDATVEEIYNTYIEAWKIGIKAVAIYRDGCKRTQPLNTSKTVEPKVENTSTIKPYRRKLPDERMSITHKFSIAGHEGYITVGMYEDHTPGEVFITMSKEGSTISGLMDGFATSVSLALQYGVPLKVLTDKFAHSRFEPSGFTNNKNIPYAKSIMDYIFRWLAIKFDKENHDNHHALEETVKAVTPVIERKTESAQSKSNGNGKAKNNSLENMEKVSFLAHEDSPPCSYCGSIMVRNGSCYKCINCGGTSGCS